MSYQVLARKWRPRTFGEMVGQEHALKALVNALDHDRLHHAYLFTGTRGVGKTTLARLLAKCLNCETGVTSSPCGSCGACREIAEGRFVDLIEVDAASRTKVEDTREMLDNVQYAPTRGRFKVYLIDEVHMLSAHSFNALLKTLEEPPPHVKFLLATTEPQKLPVTILSRCLQFNLKNLGPERIVEHLQQVLEAENIPFEEPALWALGRAAEGSMRDALSLTDQAIAHGGGQVTEAEVNAMLGTIDRTAVVDIGRAVAAGDADAALERVNGLAEHSPDYGAVLAELLSLWHRIAIAQTAPDALDHSHSDHGEVIAMAGRLTREDVQLFYQITLLGRRDLPHAADPRSGFEMVLLRLLAFQPVTPDQAKAGKGPVRTAAAEVAAPAKKPETRGGGNEPQAPPQQAPHRRADIEVPAATGSPDPETPPKARFDTGGEIDEQPGPAVEPVARQASREEMGNVSVAGNGTTPQPARGAIGRPTENASTRITLETLAPENWIAVYQDLGLGGVVGNTAANLELLERDGDCLHFCLDAGSSSLYDDSHQGRLAENLSGYFGTGISVSIQVGEVSRETPRAHARRVRAERQRAAVDSLRNDPGVETLVREFGGELLEDTVQPID